MFRNGDSFYSLSLGLLLTKILFLGPLPFLLTPLSLFLSFYFRLLPEDCHDLLFDSLFNADPLIGSWFPSSPNLIRFPNPYLFAYPSSFVIMISVRFFIKIFPFLFSSFLLGSYNNGFLGRRFSPYFFSFSPWVFPLFSMIVSVAHCLSSSSPFLSVSPYHFVWWSFFCRWPLNSRCSCGFSFGPWITPAVYFFSRPSLRLPLRLLSFLKEFQRFKANVSFSPFSNWCYPWVLFDLI